MRHTGWLGLSIVVLALLGTAPALAAEKVEKVPARGSVSFVSGGVGIDSEAQLKAREKEFNLKLVFTLVEGNYLADVGVRITDAAGKMVIEHVADGPLFLAKVPSGAYTVTATYSGKTQTRKVKVGDRLHTEYLRWPSDPARDMTLPPEGREAAPARATAARAPAPRKTEGASMPGGVSYVSGGIGEDSEAQLKAREKEFNLKLVFTLVEGNYLADVNVAIKDAGGKTLVEHTAQGPFLLAKLPGGTYAVSATYEGKTQSRKVRIGERMHTEYFRWAANPQTDFSVPRESAR
ncbi:MAG: T9SS type A sorting domain-containing protein [Betaproteobacteria bacterium]|nr:T9SS type A sorting domain-containing protein [Betaproteobacteria bacterium]